jgi:hypothetical protein
MMREKRKDGFFLIDTVVMMSIMMIGIAASAGFLINTAASSRKVYDHILNEIEQRNAKAIESIQPETETGL